MSKQITLPAKLKGYSLDDLELFCICGHYVNAHSNGLGGGISICEHCACCYCEFDYESTVAIHYFQGKYENWYITKMTTDAKRFWSITQGGLPYMKEPHQMIITDATRCDQE